MKELSKAITIGALIQMDVGNPNAGWPEGIVTVMKKVELPNGEVHPYISGQALRRYLRDSIAELPDVKADDEIAERSSPEISQDPKAPVLTPGDPKKFIDDDLFGFMRALAGTTRLRESPLRVSAGYGLFPYTGDRDLGTKSALKAISRIAEKQPKKLEELAKLLKVKGKKEEEIKKAVIAAAHRGAMFESEVTNNVYRTALLLELDRLGRWEAYESLDAKKGDLLESERKRRCKLLLQGLRYLWGGARRTRMLVDLTPQFIVYARMSKKVPMFINALDIEFTGKAYKLDLELLRQVVMDFKADIQKLVIGVRRGFLTNEEEIQILDARPQSIGEAFDVMIRDIKAANF